MKITPFGIFFAAVSFLAILYIFKRLRQDQLGFRSAVIWLILWGGAGICSLFPDILSFAMHATQMGNRMLFVLLSGVIVLFALLFNISTRMDRLERNISKTIQELAILKSAEEIQQISSEDTDAD